MSYRLLADTVLIVHLAFILFVVGGGFLLGRFPRLVWLHLPAALWGGFVELSGGVCPLTPLENHFRELGGEAGYTASFVNHYLTRLIYPEGLDRGWQLGLGLAVLLINLVAYCRWWWRGRRDV